MHVVGLCGVGSPAVAAGTSARSDSLPAPAPRRPSAAKQSSRCGGLTCARPVPSRGMSRSVTAGRLKQQGRAPPRAVSAPTDGLALEEVDGDIPTPGYASVPEALAAIAAGGFVVVMDDEDRENEGDLIASADLMTTESMAFLVRHTSGVVCVALEDSRADELKLPLMVNDKENDEKLRTAFCITCDLKEGITTGISAAERAATVRAIADPATVPSQLQRPGHVFPLRYRAGGVLRRAGHTEAAVDLSRLAGCAPVGVLCEVVAEDGSMARAPALQVFAEQHGLPMLLIKDLVRYRRKREELVRLTAVARLPTEFGLFSIRSYTALADGIEHVAMVYGDGDVGDGCGVLCRVHSECLTGDIFASQRCDCGPQLHASLQRIAKEGAGVVVYLRGQEGRGIGLGAKLLAYNLQDAGRDTVEANLDQGLPVDAREYGVAAHILRDVGVKSVRLMTNNPAKFAALRRHGVAIAGRVPLLTPINPENRRYIETKQVKLGHYSGDERVEPDAGALTCATPAAGQR